MPFNFQESFQGELKGGLRELEAHSQWRSLAETQGPGFCSNSYLELLRHAVLEEARVRAMSMR